MPIVANRRAPSWVLIPALLVLACVPGLETAELGDLRLESGKTLKDCRIGYRTFGELDPARGNAVLMSTWSMGTSRELAKKVGPGKLIDSSRYFVIAVDALGNGVSSSPSNSTEQPGSGFPRFGIRDMVESQYRLVTEVLGLTRLRAVVGISLGGMQAIQWATLHPEFLDKAVSIAGTPRSSPADRRRWQSWAADLRSQPAWKRAAHELGNWSPRSALSQLGLDADDYTAQAGAIIGHDVAAPFGGSLERAAAAFRGKMLVVVSRKDEVVDPAASVEFARLAGAEFRELDGRCGHGAPSCEEATLAPIVARFLER